MIGAFSMSKHGIESFSDALGAELAPFGVRVSVIEPGNYGTSIGRNMLARTDTSLVNGSRFERQWRSALATMRSNAQRLPFDPSMSFFTHSGASHDTDNEVLASSLIGPRGETPHDIAIGST